MSNELVNLSDLGIEVPEENKELAELSKSAITYLPQLRVYGSEADIVKEGNFPMGHLGLYFNKENIVDLGKETNILVIHFRPRAAILLSGEPPTNFYDIKSNNFQDIVEKAKNRISGHQFGLEYFMYFFAIEKFGLFFMGNATLRRESDNVKSHTGKAITLEVKLIKDKKHTWHGCMTLSCDAPVKMPSKEDIVDNYNTYFTNPKDTDLDLVDDSSEERAR